jgi:hypothetical protein
MVPEAILIRRALGVLRATPAGHWQVRLDFEVAIPSEGVELWNDGTGWSTLDAAPTTSGFDGLRLAADCALSTIEADIERRGCLPIRAFADVEWSGDDDASRHALRDVLEVEKAADVLGDLDWLRGLLRGHVTGGSPAAVPDVVWVTMLGAIDATEILPSLGPVIAGLDVSGLITPLSVSHASLARAGLAVEVDAAIAVIEAWIEETPQRERITELRRTRSARLAVLCARAETAPIGAHTVEVELVLHVGEMGMSMEVFDAIGEEVEVALDLNGEYVGQDYLAATQVLHLYLLGPDLPAMLRAVLPAVERLAGPGSYYEWRRQDAPTGVPPIRVDL